MQALFTKLGGIKPVYGNAFTPISEEQISALEKTLDCRFPEDYRKFATTFGACTFHGESPENPYVVFRSSEALPAHIANEGLSLFDAFYGSDIGANDPYGLKQRINFYMGRMPTNVVPIGDDGGAGVICLGLRNNDKGKVFYWDQRNERLSEEEHFEEYLAARPPESLYQNMYLIADSFIDFLQQLQLPHPKASD